MRTQIIAGMLALLAGSASGHELQDNRATIVLRDKINLSMTLFLNYPEALHLALSPQRTFSEFLVVYSSMKPEDLRKELQRAETKFQAETKLVLSPGVELTITNWIWPDSKQVQEMLQQRVMQAMVDPGNHTHAAPAEIHAAAIAKREVVSVRVQFPEAFRQVVVVAFRPSQLTLDPNALSSEIKF